MGNAGLCSAACCSDLAKQHPIAQILCEEYPSAVPPEHAVHGAGGLRAEDGPVIASAEAQVPSPMVPFVAQAPPPQDRLAKRPYAREATKESLGTESDHDHLSVAISAVASDSTAATMTPDVGQAKQAVKSFVRAYVKGREVCAVSVNGGVASCWLSLDRKLTTLTLQKNKKDTKKRAILLEDIVEICVGEELEDVELPLDDLCVTLLLGNDQAIGFRFGGVEERDNFALCMSMFVDGRRSEVARRQGGKVA